LRRGEQEICTSFSTAAVEKARRLPGPARLVSRAIGSRRSTGRTHVISLFVDAGSERILGAALLCVGATRRSTRCST